MFAVTLSWLTPLLLLDFRICYLNWFLMTLKILEDPFYIWRRDSWVAEGGKMPSSMSYIGKAYK